MLTPRRPSPYAPGRDAFKLTARARRGGRRRTRPDKIDAMDGGLTHCPAPSLSAPRTTCATSCSSRACGLGHRLEFDEICVRIGRAHMCMSVSPSGGPSRAFAIRAWHAPARALMRVGSTRCSRAPVHARRGATDAFGRQSNTGGALGVEVVAGALARAPASTRTDRRLQGVCDLSRCRGRTSPLHLRLLLESADGPRLAVPRGAVAPFTRVRPACTWRRAAARRRPRGYAIGALLKDVDAAGRRRRRHRHAHHS